MHIIHALLDAGPIQAGGTGPAALSWAEIEAWQRCSQSHLQSHELVLLRELSCVYLEQWEKSRDRMCPPPEVIRPEGLTGKQLVGRIKDVLRG